MWRNLPIFLLILLPFANLSAQSSSGNTPPKTYYELTPGSDLGGLTLPYDSAFTLKIHLKQRESLRDGVLLIAGKGNKKLGEFLNSRNAKTMNATWDSSSTTFNLRFDYYYNKAYTDNYNKDIITTNRGKPKSQRLPVLIPAGPLKPSNKYSIVVIHDILPAIFNPAADGSDEGSVFAAFYKLASGKDAGAPDDSIAKWQQNAFSLYTKVRGESLVENISTLQEKPEAAYSIFETRIYPLYKDNNGKLNALTAKIKQLDDDLDLYKDLPGFKNSAATLLHYLQQSCCPGKKEDCYKPFPDSAQSAIQSLQTIWEMSEDDWRQVSAGKVYFQNRVSALFAISQAGNKNSPSQNITTSLGQLVLLRNLLSFLEIRDASYPCCAANQDTCLLPAIGQLKGYLTGEISALTDINMALSDMSKQRAAFRDIVIRSGSDFKGIDIYNTDSYIMDFQTRNSVYITPIFGYALFGFQDKFTDFSPYLGFQINFQPMNRNVPFRLIRQKTLLQRLCFTTAWTLRSVSSAGKRSDFFGNSTSLVTALGFKFSHVLMLNIGSLWFKELDPNPLLTDKKIVCTPLLSLSINFTVSQLLNGFTSLIPSL